MEVSVLGIYLYAQILMDLQNKLYGDMVLCYTKYFDIREKHTPEKSKSDMILATTRLSCR